MNEGRGAITHYFRRQQARAPPPPNTANAENQPPPVAVPAVGGKRPPASALDSPHAAKRPRTSFSVSSSGVLRPSSQTQCSGDDQPIAVKSPTKVEPPTTTAVTRTRQRSVSGVNERLVWPCSVPLRPLAGLAVQGDAASGGDSADASSTSGSSATENDGETTTVGGWTPLDRDAASSSEEGETSIEATEGDESQEYEVERILDYSWCRATNRGLYLVKWLGYDRKEDTTWEPLAHLEDVKNLLRDFYLERVSEREKATPSRKRQLQVPPDPRTSFQKRSEVVDSIFSPPPLSELNNFFIQIQQQSPHRSDEWPESRLNRTLDQISRAGPKKPLSPERLEEVRHQLMLRHLKDKRQDQLKRLKDWQREINAIDQWPLTVENNVDLEGPPRHMNYITSYKPAEGIDIPEDPPIGCECGPLCSLSTEDSCCPSTHGHLFPYTRYGRLRVDVGVPIYECNKICSCGPECANRVVQKGRKTKLCIFRTSNGCGWGVKTLEPIKRGTFVADYVGEVITSEEAEERGKKYDAEGRTYLFDLDFNLGQDNPYTVDAAFYGNVAHFINHSCDPNLSIFNVWVDCLDPNLPRICLFARRDIAKGEQITFDYCQQSTQNYTFEDNHKADHEEPSEDDQEEEENSVPMKMECRCGAENCRKRLFA